MKYTHILFSTLLIGAFGISGFSVSALETEAELQMKITNLREIHAELKAEVDAGTLSKEDARARWYELLEEARAEKEAFFEKKRAQIEARYKAMLENNPERAEIFKEHIDAMKERHEARVEEHAELKAKIETGEITRQEANTLRVEFIKNQQNNFKELKADLKERRMHFQEQNAEARGFIKLMDVKGESDDKQKSRGYIKIQGVEGEARATNFLELGDIKGETRNDAQARLEAGAVGSIGFDPVGTRALQAFPDIKADINAAANFRVRDIDKATPKLQ
tara:strand:- start:573 stop:1406 length:834 start_codon:yes stop_codon:yes gene_type:complete